MRSMQEPASFISSMTRERFSESWFAGNAGESWQPGSHPRKSRQVGAHEPSLEHLLSMSGLAVPPVERWSPYRLESAQRIKPVEA